MGILGLQFAGAMSPAIHHGLLSSPPSRVDTLASRVGDVLHAFSAALAPMHSCYSWWYFFWSGGPLVCFSSGPLVPWSAGPPVPWSAGSLFPWSAGPLTCILLPALQPKDATSKGDVANSQGENERMIILFASGGGGCARRTPCVCVCLCEK